MRRVKENIEIQEPPLQEIKKKHSCVRQSCVTGCGCIVIFLIGVLLLLKFAANPKPKELKDIPEHVPEELVLYDKGSINRITFVSGKKRGRSLEIAAYLPKIILSPLLLALDLDVPLEKKVVNNGSVEIKKRAGFEDFYRLMKTSVADHRDIVKIEWTSLPAPPDFIFEYYGTELERKGYTLNAKSRSITRFQFGFSKDNIDGALFVEDDRDAEGTDYVSLTINVPSQE